MINLEVWLKNSLNSLESAGVQCSAETHDFDLYLDDFIGGGLFLEPSVPASFVTLASPSNFRKCSCVIGVSRGGRRRRRWVVDGGGRGGRFLSVTLSAVKGAEGEGIGEILGPNGEKSLQGENVALVEAEKGEKKEKPKVREQKMKALNMIKHLWAGAVAAMVSRFSFFYCPLLLCLCASFSKSEFHVFICNRTKHPTFVYEICSSFAHYCCL